MSVVRLVAFSLSALVSALLAQPYAAELRASLSEQHTAKPPAPALDVAPPPEGSGTGAPLRVLFVGNSLTATHRMPVMVARLAAAAGGLRPLVAVQDTPGGFGLQEHAARDQIQQRLASTRFDFVVLQDQGVRPGLPDRREQWTFVPARKLHALVQAAGARTLLFGTYARREGDFHWDEKDTYEALQSRVDEGYAQLGAELGVPVVPVGRIWRETLRTHPRVRLWLPDGMHPTPAGTYLAACAFFVQLYGQTPVGNAYLAGVDPTEARVIQEMVARELIDRPVH